MNIVPHVGFSPIPMLDRLMQVARQNPNAVAHIQRLAYRYGPAAMAHVRQFLDQAGYRAGRAVRDWIGRHVRPRRNQFMLNARRALGRAQQTRIRRLMNDRVDVKSQFSQVRGSRGFVGSRRGGTGRARGGGRRVGRRRMPMRYGGRPMRQPELKSYDLTNNTVPLSFNITLVQVPVRDLTLGVTSNQRIGRKVFCKSLLLVGKILSAVAPTANTTSDSVWFWIVLDRQSNGTTATPADVWLDVNGSRALKNLDQGPRFKILRCMEVKVEATAVGTHINQPFELYMPLGITVHWKGLTNFPPYKNDILLFASNSNALNTGLQIEFSTRVRYTDV